VPLLSRSFITLLFALVCSVPAFAGSQPTFDCTPSFPLRAPWLGADDAYSIPLHDGRDIWIFGDTLWGEQRQVTGDEPRMVRNTLGVSTCRQGEWKIDYIFRKGKDDKFLDFFQPQHKNTWYWPMDGVVYKNELWVTLLCVRNATSKESAALGFEICGTDLARASGIDKDPQQWKVTYFPLVPDGVHANPSSSTVIKDGFLYIYTLYEEGSRPMVLTRIPLDSLADAKAHMQYLGADDSWHDGLEPAKAKAIMAPGASEMSVRYHPELKKWLALMVEPDIFSGKVILRVSPTMTGPWSKSEVIYSIPEMQKDYPHHDTDTFCYAGKEHPEFEKAGELVFTYACNTMKPKKLEAETDIYFPKVVRMPMPDISTLK